MNPAGTTMARSALPTALTLLLATLIGAAQAATPKYEVHYSARFLPAAGSADIQISTRPVTGRLIALDLRMPVDIYIAVSGDGSIERHGDRVLWLPPRTGGALRYRVAVEHRRSDGAYDSRMTPKWVITRGDRLFPAAKVRATKGSGSTAKLSFKLPPGWSDVETAYSKVADGEFAITNAERKFDRPVGWIGAGDLFSTRETIAGTRVTIAAPKGERVDHVATMAIVRQALPEMRLAFGKLPDKILIVRSGDPMWRGGLSAPGSLWLHAQRPLLSENGTSPLLHELTHVITDIRGDGADDWISEGIAEYYSLDIGHRAGLISAKRFALSIKSADTSGAKVEKLRASESARDRTRKAVALFAALDQELRANGATGIDQLTTLLMRRETVSLNELRADAEKLEGRPSRVLASVK